MNAGRSEKPKFLPIGAIIEDFRCNKCKYIASNEKFYNKNFATDKRGIYICPKCGSKDQTPLQGALEAKKKIDEFIGIEDRKSINYMSVNDILNFKKSDKFLIEDVIYPNTINAIISPPSGFKSMISMHMAICISQGTPFFGYKTQKGPVLIIDNENNYSFIKSRYEAVIDGMELDKSKLDIHYLVREGKMDDDDFVSSVMKFVKEHNIKLIVIDTLLRSHNLEENSSKDMNHLYDQFCKLLINESSVMFLHHTTKQGRYRGSSDILGQVDSMFELERPIVKGDKFKLINTKNRMGEIDPIEGEITYDKEINSTTIEGMTVSSEDQKEENDNKWMEGQAFISAFAIDNPRFKTKELFDHLEAANANDELDVSKPYLKKILKWMVKQHILDNSVRGKYSVIESKQSRIDAWAEKYSDVIIK